MVTFYEHAQLIGVNTLAIVFILLVVSQGKLERYFRFCAYLTMMLACSVVRKLIREAYGYDSIPYFFTYFLSDLFLIFMQCVVLMGVLETMLRDFPGQVPQRLSFLIRLLITTALVSLPVYRLPNFYSRRILAVERDLYLIVTIIAMLLWIALAQFRANDGELRMIVCALGLSAPLQAAEYATADATPIHFFPPIWRFVYRMGALGVAIRLALWCYAVWPAAPRCEAALAGPFETQGSLISAESPALESVEANR